ncbi:MAG: AMP-binding protein [Nanohaloarchaea archaeon]|nr:AMP-binding protein [Candidatus Nanohaloarchaea archaeon]
MDKKRLDNLKKLILYCKNNIPLYSKLYSKIDIEQINTFEDFKKIIPPISKKQLLNLNNSSNIDLGLDNNTQGAMFLRVTSGTASKMACFYRSEKEIEQSAERFYNTYSKYLNNNNKRDKVIIINDFTLSYIFARHFSKCECLICLGNPFDLNHTVNIIKTAGCNVIRTTPPIALKIAQMLVSQKYTEINKFFLAGSGLSSITKQKLKDYYPQAQIHMQYGMAETAISLYQCKHNLGTNIYHKFNDDFFYEFIDDKSNNITKTDDIGELVITKYTHENPLIRYKTGDICQLKDICQCGKQNIKLLGRKEDQFKIKGIVVFKEKIDKAIYNTKKYCTGEYQLIIDEIEENGTLKSKLALYIELEPKYEKSDKHVKTKIKNKIAKEFSDNFMITEDYSWSQGIELGIFSKVDVIIKNELKGLKIKKIIDKRYSY